MVKISVLLVAFFTILNIWAQNSQTINYQAVIRNNRNELMVNTQIGIEINIHQGSVTGIVIYTETFQPKTDSNGVISIEIGKNDNFSEIDWSKGPYHIETKTAINPPFNNYTIINSSQMVSVPYALYAAKSGITNGKGNFKHYIGEKFGGGVIFHLWKDDLGNEHGLIVALVENELHEWSNIYEPIGITSQNDTDGLSNCIAIVSQPGHSSSAAKLCLDFEYDGFNDWYLPSREELKILYRNAYTVNISLNKIDGALEFSTEIIPSNDFYYHTMYFYWSSTELNSEAFVQSIEYAVKMNKSNLYRSRAIRKF